MDHDVPADAEDRIAGLERALLDERAMRQAAETRNATLVERAALWRRRAEERSVRIDRLLEGGRIGRWRRALRRAPATVVSPPAGVTVAPASVTAVRHAHATGFPIIGAATAVSSPSMTPALDTLRSTAIAADPTELQRCDLVVVEPAALTTLPGEARAAFDAWLALEGRQPLVVWAETAEQLSAAPHLVAAAAVAATTTGDGARLAACFDPTTHNPARRTDVDAVAIPPAFRAILADGSEGLVVEASLLGDPPPWLLEAAAAGVPVVVAGASHDPATAGVAARRWAHRHHASWVRAGELLAAAGVRTGPTWPRVAGILMSRRPVDVAVAVRGFSRQTYPNLELVVGLHGISPTPELAAAIDEAPFAVRVMSVSGSLTLGEGLNRAIESTGAAVLAKIDDDDHYGPAHVEDAVQALRYAGADIVAKGAQFTYMESTDTTILRRAGQEEQVYAGQVTGGSLVFRRSIWEPVGFPARSIGEDNLLLAAVRSIGGGVYVNSRWEFCYRRGIVGHTWVTDDATFLAGSLTAWPGFRPDLVEVPDLLPLPD